MTFEEYPLLAIDIGTSLIKCAMGVRNQESGVIDVIASTVRPSVGLSGDKVSDRAMLQDVLQSAIDQVVEYAMCLPKEAVISVSARFSVSVSVTSSVPISNGQVTHTDVKKLIERCQREASSVSDAYQVSHVIPLQFSLDGQLATLSPWGQAASHLSLKASVVYAKRDIYNVLWSCKEALTVGNAQLKRRPLPLRDVTDDVSVLSSSVLTSQEREEIVTVIDMGAELTKVVIFDHGRPIYTHCDFKGGRHLSRTLQKDLHLDSFHEAERVKVESGSLSSDLNAPRIRMRSGGQVKFKQQSTLSRHLERAVKQQLSALRVRLQQDQVWSYVQRGVILTGGGAQLKGLASQAESVLQSPVRVGAPTQSGVCDLVYGPHYATLNGLVNAGLTGYYDAWFACWTRPISQVPPPHHIEAPKPPARQREPWLSKLKRYLSPLTSPTDQPY